MTYIFVVAFMLSGVVQSSPPDLRPLPTVSQFAAAEVVTRRALMKDVDVRVDVTPDSTFDLIAAGLHDADADVRVTASRALRNLLTAQTKLLVDPRTKRRLEPPPSFKDALSTAFDAPDTLIRTQVVNAFVRFELDRSRVKTRLLDRYAIESVPKIRGQLLAHVREFAGHDPAARRAVLDALDDPAPEVRIQGVLGATKWTPNDALPKIAIGLLEANESLRLASVEALGAYGPRAATHLPALRQLLANASRVIDRHRIEAAITSISR